MNIDELGDKKEKPYADLPYFSLGRYLKTHFSHPVRKIGLDAGLKCPHSASGGCVFCEPQSYTFLNAGTVTEQLDAAILKMRPKSGCKYIAYFQNSSNTNAPLPVLEKLFREALAHPEVVGISIGTRPDCLPEDVIEFLGELSTETWLHLELGLQTIHERSLKFLNRGHDFRTFCDAFERVKRRKIRVGVHLILGIPGEGRPEIISTAETLADMRVDAVKLHNLFVARNTALGEMWSEGKIEIPSMEQYAAYVVDFLERVPPETVVERVAADVRPEYLLAPDWAGAKRPIIAAIETEFKSRNTRQGANASTRYF